jgi:HSP20 family protein
VKEVKAMAKELTKREQTEITSTASEQMVDAGRAFSPDVDIYLSNDDLILLADLPGVEKGAVQVGVDEENALTIRAKNSYREPCERCVRQYQVGDFYRSFRIGDEFDKERIAVRLENGLLQIRIPRREELKPKRIELTA